MKGRTALRTGSANAHRRVDAAFSRFDLASSDGYAHFLLALAAGFLPVEAALDASGARTVLPDWPERRRGPLLEADLADLSVTAPEPFSPPLILSGNAPVLGAIYVLEGSRLGGALLKRSVPAAFPKRFLDARQLAGRWRKLLETLDDLLTRQDDLDDAIQAANAVFARFEEGAKAQLETLGT